MTEVKICGITKAEDARAAAALGADALGFNFYRKSPRYIEPEKALKIIDSLPSKVAAWGVFVNAAVSEVVDTVAISGIDRVQLHGDEDANFVGELKALLPEIKLIKAFRVSTDLDAANVLNYRADAILLDAFSTKGYGGTGSIFDWEIASKIKAIFPKIYLAGGLSPENISSALQTVSPFGVDVCSGIEREKGIKDHQRMADLITLVKNYDLRT